MTARSKADAGVFDPARKTHATRRVVASAAVTAVLAVVFGLSVMVEVSNTLEGAPPAGKPVLGVAVAVAVHAASTPAGRLPGEPQPEGSAGAF